MTYQSTVLADLPSPYYRLNDVTTTIADSSTSANNGVTFGTVSEVSPGAVVGGGAMLTDGATGRAASNGALPALTAYVSFEAWVYSAGAWAAGHEIFMNVRNTTAYLDVFGGKAYMSLPLNGVQQLIVGVTALTTGQWHHLVGLWDGSSMRLYVDGVQDAASAQSGPLGIASGVLDVGCYNNGGPQLYYGGRLAEVAVYNYALTPGQIATHYQASGNLPSLSNATRTPLPPFKAQFGFTSNPLDAAQTWTDVSSLLRSAKIRRGRQHVLDQFEPGTAELVFDGRGGELDPFNTASPYAPNVTLNKQLQVGPVVNQMTYAMTNTTAPWTPTNATFSLGQLLTASGPGNASVATPAGTSGFALAESAWVTLHTAVDLIVGTARSIQVSLTCFNAAGTALRTFSALATMPTIEANPNAYVQTPVGTAYGQVTITALSCATGDQFEVMGVGVYWGAVPAAWMANGNQWGLPGGFVPLFTGFVDAIDPLWTTNMSTDIRVSATDALRLLNDINMPADPAVAVAQAYGARSIYPFTDTGSVIADIVSGYAGTALYGLPQQSPRGAASVNPTYTLQFGGNGNYGQVTLPTAAPVRAQSTNLLTAFQATAEDGDVAGQGWSAALNCLAPATTTAAQAQQGTHSWLMQSSAAGNMAFSSSAPNWGRVQYNAGVTVGNAYTASAYVRAATVGRSCTIGIAWMAPTGSTISTTTGTAVANTTTGWTQVSVTGTAPTGAVTAVVVVTVQSTAAAGEQHYLDTVQLQLGSTVGSFAVPNSDAWAIDGWVKCSSVSATIYLQSSSQDSFYTSAISVGTDGSGHLQLGILGVVVTNANVALNDGNWHYFSVGWDGLTTYYVTADANTVTSTAPPGHLIRCDTAQWGGFNSAAVAISLSACSIYDPWFPKVQWVLMHAAAPGSVAYMPQTSAPQNYQFGSTTFNAGDLSIKRATQAAMLAGWPAAYTQSATNLPSGNSAIQVPSGSLNGSSLLSYLQSVAQAENAPFYCDAAGFLRWKQRLDLTVAVAAATATKATFGDGTGEVAIMRSPDIGIDNVDLFDGSSVTRSGGTPQVANPSNTTALKLGQQRYLNESGLLITTDAESLSRAQWNVQRFGAAIARIRQIAVDVIAPQNIDKAAVALFSPSTSGGQIAVELGQCITVNRRPYTRSGGWPTSPTLSQLAMVERVEHEIDFKAGTWRASVSLAAADSTQYWVLGSSALGTGTVLAY